MMLVNRSFDLPDPQHQLAECGPHDSHGEGFVVELRQQRKK